jgi:glycosyltransferase involved in cell wall biosynthesis
MSRGSADKVEIATYDTGPRPVIALGIPSFGMVHLFFTARLINLRMPMNRIIRHFYIVGKEVGDARNEIVAKALAMEDADPSVRCSHVFFIDDDVLFHPDVLLKLLSHQRPIISGLYYTKSSVPTPLVLHGEYGGTARTWTPGEVVECAGHGMGLTLIEADVFRRMQAECDLGADPFGYPAWFKTTKDDALIRPDGVRAQFNQTEDMAFLTRAAVLGYQPAVDTSAQTFGWHLDTKSMTAYPQKQWAEFIKTGTVTWQRDGEPATVWENAA